MPDYTNDRESETNEVWRAAREKKKSEAAAARDKFQNFTTGGTAKDEPGAPKRSEFPDGLAGQASYSKALSQYRSKTRKQADALGKAIN